MKEKHLLMVELELFLTQIKVTTATQAIIYLPIRPLVLILG